MISKTHLLVTIVFTWLTFESTGQKVDQRVDKAFAKDYARWDSFYLSAIKFTDRDNQIALIYVDSAQELSMKLGDSLRVVKTHRVRGQILRRLDKTNEAIKHFLKVLAISKRNNFVGEYGYALNGLAFAYTLQANYDKALQLQFEGLVLHEKEGNCEEICTTLNNIGIVYYKLGNYEKALEYYLRDLALSKEINYIGDRDRLLINIGLCYGYLGDYTESTGRIKEGLRFCGDHCRESIRIEGNFGLGLTFFHKSKLDSAEYYFLKSYHLASKDGYRIFEVENLINLAKIKLRTKQSVQAFGLLRQAESIAFEKGYNQLLVGIYEQIAIIHNQKRDLGQAVLYLNKYQQLKDSLYDEDLIKNISRIQTDMEERENRAKISAHAVILKLKEDAILQHQFLNILMGIIVSLLIGLAIILYKTNKQKQAINLLLDQKIKERTEALEDSLNTLKRTHDEQAELIRKTSADIKSSVATIEGLCEVANLDSESPETYRKYLKEFDATAGRLSNLRTRLGSR